MTAVVISRSAIGAAPFLGLRAWLLGRLPIALGLVTLVGLVVRARFVGGLGRCGGRGRGALVARGRLGLSVASIRGGGFPAAIATACCRAVAAVRRGAIAA